MSSIKSIVASNPMPPDIAKKIGLSGVNEILAIFWMSYEDLRRDYTIVITPATEEDEITQLWYQKLILRWDSRNRAMSVALNQVIPYNQYSDDTLKKKKGSKSPTIDFCFKDWDTANSYFGAECKNLFKNRTDKITRYIETGVDNYVSGRYGSQSSENAVIGYVLSGDIPTIVGELSNQLKHKYPIMNFTRVMAIPAPQYKTQHKRILDDMDITLYHLFFEFI